MRIAKDFRKIARDALAGKWAIAVLVGLVAVLLGGVTDGGGAEISLDTNNQESTVTLAGQPIFSLEELFQSEIGGFLAGCLVYVGIIALLLGAVYFILGSFVGVGYARFNLNVVDRTTATFDSLFTYASAWKTTATTKFLKGLYVLLWTLLFLIPGIIAGYSYAMTDYILAENPQLPAREAIRQSKMMMEGNRWRLFCLEFSFIGWDMLAALTFGIGLLWLTPYKKAAYAAFYREVSGTEVVAVEEAAFENN